MDPRGVLSLTDLGTGRARVPAAVRRLAVVVSLAIALVAVSALGPTGMGPAGTGLRGHGPAGMVPTGIGPAHADPAPAQDGDHALRLAAGWLARQVTAEGQVLGVPAPADDLGPQARVVRALAAVGPGAGAAQRAWAAVLAAAEDLAALSTVQLGRLVLAAVAHGEADRVEAAVAELASRRTVGGVDDGRIGSGFPDAVAGHALAVQALRSVGGEVAPESLAWLQGQQCPTGGWPTYRDPASRQTGTCELLVPTMAITVEAVAALSAGGVPPLQDVEPFLRSAHTAVGAFADAPGLSPTPLATARGTAVIATLTGAPPDASWDGTAGGPVEAVLTEQLGCGWHGRDRGNLPESLQDVVGPAGEDPGTAPAPGAGTSPDRLASAILALATVLPPADPTPQVGDPFPDCPVVRDRAAGPDRLATAVAMAQLAFPDGADAVVLATSADFADALAASPLAGQLGAPVLLSGRDALPTATAAEVERLDPGEVVLMGGEAALSAAVAEAVAEVAPSATVRRVAGPDRWATAAAAAAEVEGDRVLLARGAGPAGSAPWADALSVGAWAAGAGIPVLLTDRDVLPAVTREALGERASAIVVGGTAAVSAAVEADAAGVTAVSRIAGSSRTGTSAAVLRAAISDGVDARHVVVATAADFPDALAAGPAAAALGATLLLVDPGRGVTDLATRTALLDVDFVVDRVTASGGPAALPDQVLADIAALVREGIDG